MAITIIIIIDIDGSNHPLHLSLWQYSEESSPLHFINLIVLGSHNYVEHDTIPYVGRPFTS